VNARRPIDPFFNRQFLPFEPLGCDKLRLVDGASTGFASVIKVTRVSLTILDVDNRHGPNVVGGDVGFVLSVQGSLVLGTDSGKDVVGALDGTVLGRLELGTRVGTRVKENKGALFGGNSIKDTRLDGLLQISNASTVDKTGLLDGSLGDGSIRRGSLGKSGKKSGIDSDLSESRTTVDFISQTGAGAL
jgi:hypothetical protein